MRRRATTCIAAINSTTNNNHEVGGHGSGVGARTMTNPRRTSQSMTKNEERPLLAQADWLEWLTWPPQKDGTRLRGFFPSIHTLYILCSWQFHHHDIMITYKTHIQRWGLACPLIRSTACRVLLSGGAAPISSAGHDGHAGLRQSAACRVLLSCM